MKSIYFLPFIKEYVCHIANEINKQSTKKILKNRQIAWLIFCLSLMLVTNSLNWARFERISFGVYKAKALSFMFYWGKIPLQKIFLAGIQLLLTTYGIKDFHLVIDDTERVRSKNTTKIAHVFKTFLTKVSGFVKCQNIVFLVLITDKITIPVGWRFYTPCPKLSQWTKDDKAARKLRKEGFQIPRPPKPERSKEHPTKKQIATELVNEFVRNFSDIKIKTCSFDAAYGDDSCVRSIEDKLPNVLAISQLKCTTLVEDNRRKTAVQIYFNAVPEQKITIKIRGGESQEVGIKNARLYVPSHKRKLHVIALRYAGEENYRFLFTSNLFWTAKAVVQAYTLRWLVEVFFFDWKCYEGWGQAATQQSYDGALCGVLLSLLIDQCLLLHPEQLRRMKSGSVPCTVGSLRERCVMDCHLQQIKALFAADKPKEKLLAYINNIDSYFKYRDSKKHMTGRDLSDLNENPYLKKRFAVAA